MGRCDMDIAWWKTELMPVAGDPGGQDSEQG